MRWRDVSWDSAAERQLFYDEAMELIAQVEDEALSDHPDLDRLFRAVHTLKGSGGLIGLTAWVDQAHTLETQLDDVRQGRAAWTAALRQATLAAVDAWRGELTDAVPAAAEHQRFRITWDATCPMPGARAYQAWEAAQAAGIAVDSVPSPDAMSAWTGFVQTLTVQGTPERVQAWRDTVQALPDCQAVVVDSLSEPTPASPDRNAQDTVKQTLRVDADVIERLLDGLGEILVDHGQLTYMLGQGDLAATTATLDHLRRRTLDLQDLALQARMLPLDTLFRQYPRAVHDLAQQLGKPIRLMTEGGETELDRVVMDRLQEPLLHLLRNACDHGIEDPDTRRRAGKPLEGQVTLRAATRQGQVILEVQDDGAGIDWDRVRAKAVQQGLIPADQAATASHDLLVAALLHPGFSTRDTASAVSGRGVGMDVVQAFVESVHGTLAVDSIRGQGTTWRFEIPMTLAIVTVLLVEAGPWVLGIPLLSVDRIDDAETVPVEPTPGGLAINDGGAPLPVVSVAQALDAAVDTTPTALVRLRDGRFRIAWAVDDVIGQQEVVVKALPLVTAQVPWLSGVALLGDGRLALIVDPRRVTSVAPTDRDRPRSDTVLRAGTNQMELLVFRLNDGVRYGINVYKTREVLRHPPVTPVPGQHAWIDGFWRLRGQTVPVINLHRALGLADPGASLAIITEFNASVQAFSVSAVEQMVRVRWDQVEPLPAILAVPDTVSRYVIGVVDHPDLGPIQILDFEQILDQIRPQSTTPTGVAAPTLPITVWAADDSRIAQRQIEKALTPLHVTVRMFSDGQALWDAVEAGDSLPTVFVLDVEMPRLDGYTLAIRLKQDPRTATIPVLLHTSLSGHWHAERAHAVDADAVLTKFDAVHLAQLVKDLGERFLKEGSLYNADTHRG